MMVGVKWSGSRDGRYLRQPKKKSVAGRMKRPTGWLCLNLRIGRLSLRRQPINIHFGVLFISSHQPERSKCHLTTGVVRLGGR